MSSATSLISEGVGAHQTFNSTDEAVSEGVSDAKKDVERSVKLCNLLDLAVALAPGIPSSPVSILYKAAQTTLQV